MEKTNKRLIKALTPADLAGLYGVSTRTLKSWVNRQGEKIGTRVTRYFTALQVQQIFECLGYPKEYEITVHQVTENKIILPHKRTAL